VAAEYQAAGEGDEVTGAFYDIFKIPPGRCRSAIRVSGDLAGMAYGGHAAALSLATAPATSKPPLAGGLG